MTNLNRDDLMHGWIDSWGEGPHDLVDVIQFALQCPEAANDFHCGQLKLTDILKLSKLVTNIQTAERKRKCGS